MDKGKKLLEEHRKKKKREEAEESLNDLKSVGANPGKGDPVEIVEEFENLDYDTADDMDEVPITDPLPDEPGRYRHDQKYLSIMFLSAWTRDYDGKETPNFSKVSRFTGVPISTLSLWWDNKEKILNEKTQIEKFADKYAENALTIELIRMLNEMGRTDYGKLSNKEFTRRFDLIVKNKRLFANQATEHVKKEYHHIMHVPPDKALYGDPQGRNKNQDENESE